MSSGKLAKLLQADRSGNEIRGTSYWLLLFREPQLKIPLFSDDNFEDLRSIAHQTAWLQDDSRSPDSPSEQEELQQLLLRRSPRDLRCSAYALSETINLSAWSRNPAVSALLPSGRPRRTDEFTTMREVQYEFTSITSDRFIDTGTTYGVRINFSAYWDALLWTPTRWSTINHGSETECLVAHSAWGTTRMWVDGGLLLLSFIPLDDLARDHALYGRGWGSLRHRHIVWIVKELWNPNQCYHLRPHQLLRLRSTIEVVVDSIRFHVPTVFDNAPTGSDGYLKATSTNVSNDHVHSDTLLEDLKVQCEGVIDGFISGARLSSSRPDKVQPFEPDLRQVVKAFQNWKTAAAVKPGSAESRPEVGILCRQHACCASSKAAANGPARRADEETPECEVGIYLSQTFCTKSFLLVTRRLTVDIQAKPLTERKRWVEGVLVGCLEMLSRISMYCDRVRIIPEIAETIRPWDWRTAYIV